MEITEVRVKLVEKSAERLRAFCSITLDGDFVIRDLKIIDGLNGAFVAMPSRKLADRCPRCGSKNHLRARFCNDCGAKLNEGRAPKDPQGRAKLHADVAHPINAACRERIQNAVIVAFEAELERSKQPDYKPPSFDDYEDDDFHVESPPASTPPEPAEPVEQRPRARTGKGSRGQESDDKGGAFEDYNSLIADLKREAATRRGTRDDDAGGSDDVPVVEDEAEEQDAAPPEPVERPAPAREEPRPARESGPRDRDRRSDRGGRDRGRERSAPPPAKPAPPPADEEDDFAAGLM